MSFLCVFFVFLCFFFHVGFFGGSVGVGCCWVLYFVFFFSTEGKIAVLDKLVACRLE